MLILAILSLFLAFFLLTVVLSYGNKQKFFHKPKPKEHSIFLTFDDGPSQDTAELLKLLKKYEIKATFFCVADFAKAHPEIIQTMKKDGHCIGLHSLKHKNAMLQGIRETKKDLKESLQIMKELDVSIHDYRPPWGDVNWYLLRKLKQENLRCILWNVMAEDWEADTTPDSIAHKLLARVSDGDIICLHDGRGKNQAPRKTILALEQVLPIFLEKGFQFKTIDEYKN